MTARAATKARAPKRPPKSLVASPHLPKPTVYIVGFAPSWPSTPWTDPSAELWGMNALHKVAGNRPWSRWYQLHDIDTHHPQDRAEHVAWLRNSNVPIVMWEESVAKYIHELPNAVPYPKQAVLAHFGTYFTNTVSWMIAQAILEHRTKIGVYGVDMAQETEYGVQRPSCEFFLGWARGAGIQIDLPDTSDLLRTPYLYGVEDMAGSAMRKKYEARRGELQQRIQETVGQRDNLHSVFLQLQGALEDVNYWIRAYTNHPSIDGQARTT